MRDRFQEFVLRYFLIGLSGLWVALNPSYCSAAKLVKDMQVEDILMDSYPELPAPAWYYPNKAMVSATTFTPQDSGSANASVIEKIQLSYFSSNDCTGAPLGSGRQIITGGSFAISLGTTFSLNASSAYKVGNVSAGITTMTSVQSIAVVFQPALADIELAIPQSNFSGKNFACLASLTCTPDNNSATGTCTDTGGPYSFSLRERYTDVLEGDPAEGGLVASDSSNIIVYDPSISLYYGPSITTGATGTGDGSTVSNTTAIINCYTSGAGVLPCTSQPAIGLDTFQAGYCDNLIAPGGYTNWGTGALGSTVSIAPHGLYPSSAYWTNTEFNNPIGPNTQAYYINSSGSAAIANKSTVLSVYCVTGSN